MRKRVDNNPVTGVGKMEIGQKIRQLRIERGMNQPQLAKQLGVTKNAVTNWESGISRPEVSTIKQICCLMDVSADSLFDLPSKADNISSSEWDHLRRYRELTVYDQRSVDALMEAMRVNGQDSFREICKENNLRIPVNTLKASAGSGNPLGENYETEYMYLRRGRNAYLADEIITVTGDSMMPTYRDGDQLLVQHTQFLRAGEIGIFVLNGEGYVKEYQKDRLHSHNPSYPDVVPCKEDEVRCIGRVLGLVTKDMLVSTREAAMLDDIYADT